VFSRLASEAVIILFLLGTFLVGNNFFADIHNLRTGHIRLPSANLTSMEVKAALNKNGI
jgi:hypothetical protein